MIDLPGCRVCATLCGHKTGRSTIIADFYSTADVASKFLMVLTIAPVRFDWQRD